MIVRLTIEIEQKIALSDGLDPAIPIAIFEVIKVGFMIVGFLFKNNVPIS